jgi:hypothetical protein
MNRVTDFTHAIYEVIHDRDVMSQHPEGIAPADILAEVWKKYPGQFQLCTVIDVCNEMDAVYGT